MRQQAILTAAAVLLATIPSLCGCQSLNKLRGEGFDDEVAESVGRMRKPDPDNKSKWGATTKAQEIENNLGIR